MIWPSFLLKMIYISSLLQLILSKKKCYGETNCSYSAISQ